MPMQLLPRAPGLPGIPLTAKWVRGFTSADSQHLSTAYWAPDTADDSLPNPCGLVAYNDYELGFASRLKLALLNVAGKVRWVVLRS